MGPRRFHAAVVMHYGNSWKPANLLEVLPGQKVAGIPFTLLGVGALVILSVMALTSWDHFLHAWTPPAWKRLHMAVYAAYALIVFHFTARFVGDPPVQWRFLVLLWLVALAVAGLHVAASIKEARRDRPAPVDGDGLVFLGTFADLPEGHAATVHVDGERVAVVRKAGTLYAISNVCPHQNGPLGEGTVRDGYLECPWHGYQFDPCTGLGPPGFTDSVPTYELVQKGKEMYSDCPLPAGRREPHDHETAVSCKFSRPRLYKEPGHEAETPRGHRPPARPPELRLRSRRQPAGPHA